MLSWPPLHLTLASIDNSHCSNIYFITFISTLWIHQKRLSEAPQLVFLKDFISIPCFNENSEPLKLEVEDRWAMSNDAFLGKKLSLLSTSSMVLRLFFSGSVFYQSSIIYPSSVIHHSYFCHTWVINPLRSSSLFSIHSAPWPQQMQPRQIPASA